MTVARRFHFSKWLGITVEPENKMTTEQAAEIIKLLRSLDGTGWIVLGFLGGVLGAIIGSAITRRK